MAKDYINLVIYTKQTLKSIEAVLIIDSEGNKLVSKYYSQRYKTEAEQRKLEQNLFEKTKRSSSDIILYNGQVVVYRPVVDLFIYFLGGLDENEIILSNVLQVFVESLSNLLKNQLEKRTLMENLDMVFLTLDETVDDGIILETDSSVITSRVTSKSESVPLGDQTLSSVWKSAQEQARSWIS